MTHAQLEARRARVAAYVPRRTTGPWPGWALLALSLAVYAAVSVALGQPFHAGGLRLRFFDLRIYRVATLRLVHGVALYQRPILRGYGFTYPPAAGLVLVPLGLLSLAVDKLVVLAVNVGLLVWGLRRALLIRSGDDEFGSSPAPAGLGAWSLAAALGAFALWLEPVSVTLGYGQINLLITALVVFDLSRPDRAPGKGLAIGLAAAIKLTPLLFIPYLLFSGRRRAAAVAAATFVASVLLGFLVVPRDASRFWFGAIFQTSRVGSPIQPANQSLLGLIDRLVGSSHPGSMAEPIVALVALGGLALAVRLSRRGDEAGGYALAGLSALLASPISWDHHWTLVVPALVLFGRRARGDRSRARLAGAIVLVGVGYAYLPELAESQFSDVHGPLSLLSTDPYPVVALIVLAWVAGVELSSRRHRTADANP